MNQNNTLTESMARFILQHDFVCTDFAYDVSKSPIDNLLRAIEMYGERRREDGDTYGYDRGYEIGYTSGYDSAVGYYAN